MTAREKLTSEDFEAAFLAIQEGISEQQKVMLRAHLSRRTISMTELAQVCGYNHYGAANLQYGRMCGSLGARLGLYEDAPRLRTIAFESPHRNEKGHVQWTMKESVARALRNLGWFSDESATQEMGELVGYDAAQIV